MAGMAWARATGGTARCEHELSRQIARAAIIVREDLAQWQRLNVTAFLISGVAGPIGRPDCPHGQSVEGSRCRGLCHLRRWRSSCSFADNLASDADGATAGFGTGRGAKQPRGDV